MALGWFGEDVADAVGGALSDAWDVVDDLPGFANLGDATKAVFTGPLRDFAKTTLGQTVLRAMTGPVMSAVGWVAGPWAMMTAASLPGVVRGDSFTEALFSENLWRLSKAAEILGTDFAGELVAQYGTAIEELKTRARAIAPDLEPPAALAALAEASGLDPQAYARKLAADLGIREDMAAQAFELLGRVSFDTQDAYDVTTGRELGVVRRPRTSRATMRNDRVLDALDPGRNFRQAARAASASLLNPSPALAIFREARAVAPSFERAPMPEPEPRPSGGVPVVGVALLGVAAAAAAVWYARRR